MMNRQIQRAISAALRTEKESAPDTAAEVSAAGADGEQSILAAELQRRAGRTLGSMRVVPVDRDHQHYPPSKKFNVIGETVFIRREDAAGLQAALLRRRALTQGQHQGE